MLRKRCDRGIGVAPEYGMHDGGVFGSDVTDGAGLAADRQPAVALALLMQHIGKAEQPLRAAGIDQRPVENAVTGDPDLIVAVRIVLSGCTPFLPYTAKCLPANSRGVESAL